MNPAPNPFGAPGPLPSKPEAKEPHHQPTPSPVTGNPFAAPPSSPRSNSKNLEWGTILDDLPFGLIVLDPHMEVLHENSTCREWLGIGIREAGGIEAWIARLCPEEEHREKVLHSWRSHIWRNQLTRAFSLKGTNQKVREIEFRSNLQPDGGLTVVLQDVSETFRAQELQRQSKLKFRALFDHSPQGVALLDREEKVLEANSAFLRLAGRNLRGIRLTPFEDLLHPSSLPFWQKRSPTEGRTQKLVFRNNQGTKDVLVRCAPREGNTDLSPLTMVFVEENIPSPTSHSEEGPKAKMLLKRLQTVARKAQSLLDAVPDLILLVDRDLTIADFSAPPEPWKEHHPQDSWRGESLEAVWPILGQLLARSYKRILEQGKTIHADLEARNEGAYYSMSASNAGDGQILVVVRNQSELEHLRRQEKNHSSTLDALSDALLFFDKKGRITGANPAAEQLLGEPEAQLTQSSLLERTGKDSILELTKANRWPFRDRSGIPRLLESRVFDAGATGQYGVFLGSPPSPQLPQENRDDPFVAEQAEHQFRNQLQLATSLHQFEPVTPESREASLRWQIRLRTLMATRPDPETGRLSVSALLHGVAGEIGSLSGRGPGSRCVAIEGAENLWLAPETMTSLGLFIGEVLRIVLIGSEPASGPDLHFRFLKDSRGFLQLQFQTGPTRHKISEARAWEGEILEILAAQMQGSLTGRPIENNEEWTLCAAVLDKTS